MFYYKAVECDGELWLKEDVYDEAYLKKSESVLSQCNGHFGIRASTELPGIGRSPGMFVSGLYDKEPDGGITELVNCPDLTQWNISIDGRQLAMNRSQIESFSREINPVTGELRTNMVFVIDYGMTIQIRGRRFASREDRNFFFQEMQIEYLRGIGESEIVVSFGIDGQTTNSGVSHFSNVRCRVYSHECMEYKGELSDDGLHILSGSRWYAQQQEKQSAFYLSRRGVFEKRTYHLLPGQSIKIFRANYISENSTEKGGELEEKISNVAQALHDGYLSNLSAHQLQMKRIAEKSTVSVSGMPVEEKAAVLLALYHLMGMTPDYTNQYSIGAKGLTGEGYKGHVFWDTELFILPFFTAVFPGAARKLLEYRYRGRQGAIDKARQYGYKGWMYPWETAKDGGEETPLYAAINIHTGEANKVWSGIKEHHITADIAVAVYQYYMWTRDVEFMQLFGLEMVCETADFWVSRAEEVDGRLQIRDVIGPDEYNEHVDNNAYTNYMAAKNVELALKFSADPIICQSRYGRMLRSKRILDKKRLEWSRFLDLIYLPAPDDRGIIPQDDVFFGKAELKQIEKYKKSLIKQEILRDYSRDEVIDMQVLKQADLVMLFSLFPNLFSEDIVAKNTVFYEKKTVHDSSLSYCTHAQVWARMGNMKMAQLFFGKALQTDLCANPHDTQDGIHAAAMGGIWNALVFGYAGVFCDESVFHLDPHIPSKWKEINFSVVLYGAELRIRIDHTYVELQYDGKSEISVDIAGNIFSMDRYAKVKYSEGNI